MELKFRIATSEDAAWVGSHDVELPKVIVSQKIAREEVVLALLDGQRIGFLRWGYFWDTIPFMNMLILDKAFRRRGYGTLLVTHWERLMHSRGAKQVMTSTLSDEYAQHFYRKMGYRDMGSLFFPDEALEIVFMKELS